MTMNIYVAKQPELRGYNMDYRSMQIRNLSQMYHDSGLLANAYCSNEKGLAGG